MTIAYCPFISCRYHATHYEEIPDKHSTGCHYITCLASKEELRIHGELLHAQLQVETLEKELRKVNATK